VIQIELTANNGDIYSVKFIETPIGKEIVFGINSEDYLYARGFSNACVHWLFEDDNTLGELEYKYRTPPEIRSQIDRALKLGAFW
jgi:hypothetical protein